jgi:hypothetical protein
VLAVQQVAVVQVVQQVVLVAVLVHLPGLPQPDETTRF